MPARVHGRVLVAGHTEPGAPLLVGCHGYGEHAGHLLDALERLPDADRWLLASVEALHPFYNRKTREVVGSWMTSRLREQAIRDNTAYVLDAVASVRARFRTAPQLVLAGFSQGVAMAYRAAAALGAEARGLVVLAGDVPPDVASGWGRGGAMPPILIGRGTRDEWYTERKMTQDLSILADLGADVETCVFRGGHEWSSAFLTAMSAFLARSISSQGPPEEAR